MLKKAGFVLVILMAVLQGIYALLAYWTLESFATIRGTDLVSQEDIDWIIIYASRTLFIALVVGYLAYKRELKLLFWIAVFGMVMPITDAYLAYQADAAFGVIFKHILTLVYLGLTASILAVVIKKPNAPQASLG